MPITWQQSLWDLFQCIYSAPSCCNFRSCCTLTTSQANCFNSITHHPIFIIMWQHSGRCSIRCGLNKFAHRSSDLPVINFSLGHVKELDLWSQRHCLKIPTNSHIIQGAWVTYLNIVKCANQDCFYVFRETTRLYTHAVKNWITKQFILYKCIYTRSNML
jgi:hypothetical protein